MSQYGGTHPIKVKQVNKTVNVNSLKYLFLISYHFFVFIVL